MTAVTPETPDTLATDALDLGGSTLPALLLHRAEATPARVALRKQHLGIWKQYTWAEYAERAAVVGLGLRALGVEPGDRVAVHSLNRPAWALADMGTQGIGAVCVGVYPTSPAAEVEYLLAHSGAKVLIAEDEEQVDKALEVRARLPALSTIVVVDPRGVDLSDPALLTFAELEERGRAESAGDGAATDFAGLVARLDPAEAALIVYTSGTTGPPKGAMLSHANLIAAARNGGRVFDVSPDDEVLSYLPMCHIAERLISVVDAVAHGYVVNFGDGVDVLAADLRAVQPTFFLGVPRVWEKLLATITVRMQDAGLVKRANYRFWMARGRSLARRRWHGRLGPLASVEYALGWLLLYRTLRQKIGMRRMRYALSGAAPVAPQVLEFFWALGVPVLEGYGMTENSAQATVTPAGDVRLGQVGRAVPDCELRIADDGEILTRGPATFLGYFHDPEATAAAIDPDGWLHTGDVGHLDEDGFLTITDRKKDIIITAGGKNVSPSEIENALKVSPYVREAAIVGDQRKHLVALIGVELDTVGAWAQQRRLPFTTYADLSSKPEVVELIDGVVTEVNAGLAAVEQVKRFALLPKELEHEDGEVTATQKVKRRALEQTFATEIEALYR
ncbi:MAG TPA: AMP-binding protein [Acidimicrobiales bacterium]|nr:AMP-binding protein [Acidimicrobiales bacterium]